MHFCSGTFKILDIKTLYVCLLPALAWRQTSHGDRALDWRDQDEPAAPAIGEYEDVTCVCYIMFAGFEEDDVSKLSHRLG